MQHLNLAYMYSCSLLEACPFETGAVACANVDGDDVLVYDGGSSTCMQTATAINSMITEYTGPGGRTEDIECFIGEYFRDSTNCDQTKDTLNEALIAFRKGIFAQCTITRPSTSKTTSQPT